MYLVLLHFDYLYKIDAKNPINYYIKSIKIDTKLNISILCNLLDFLRQAILRKRCESQAEYIVMPKKSNVIFLLKFPLSYIFRFSSKILWLFAFSLVL